MTQGTIRVRFAPAPTGMMHLGNVRTALMNYLFARQHGGTFVLRIEDTDPKRNFDPGGRVIIDDLTWLNMTFDEGPGVGGPYEPYLQSERTPHYEQIRETLEKSNKIYRCFCTQEELEKKRQRQQALRLPPRYDRSCMRLDQSDIDQLLASGKPFVWRLKLDHSISISIEDLARGTITFEMRNFSDFPITRQDGTFTFMFANFVDDLLMKITYVLRGEDHLTNTAGQAALYHAVGAALPIFWHMPIICNLDGKKLSKRDFGFSLQDLHKAGYLPEAINNYLATIGGSFSQEILTLDELVKAIRFDQQGTASQIKYDPDKLNWFNHQWLISLEPIELAQRCRPFLAEKYPRVEKIDDAALATLIQPLKSNMTTLVDSVTVLGFYFAHKDPSESDIRACTSPETRAAIAQIVTQNLDRLAEPTAFADHAKQAAREQSVPLKELFWFLRLALTGSSHGPAIAELVGILGPQESRKRIEHALELLGRIN